MRSERTLIRIDKVVVAFAAALFLGALCSRSIGAEKPKLSPAIAQSLADAAAQKVFVDNAPFFHRVPVFDPVTRVWSIEFMEKTGRPKSFSVFVYDATSHTEVTCLGRSSYGQVMDKIDLPEEVRPFVPDGESATELVCADLNGEGREDYVLVSENYKPETRSRTLFVLIRTPDGKLSSIVRNRHVVNEFGDVYTVVARRERIEIINTIGGSGGADVFSLYFQYSVPDKTWLLTRAEKELTGYAHTNDDQPFTQLPRDFGRITIDEFVFQTFAAQ